MVGVMARSTGPSPLTLGLLRRSQCCEWGIQAYANMGAVTTL